MTGPRRLIALFTLFAAQIVYAAPELERIIGWDGQLLDQVRGMAAGPDGSLYVVYGEQLYAHRQTTLISAFDRTGTYQRQIFPASRTTENKAGWPHIQTEAGSVPVIFQGLSRCPYPGAVFGNRVMPVVTGDGERLILLSAPDHGSTIKHTDQRGGRRLLILGTDGSVGEDYLGPVVAPEFYGGAGHLALSPDERFAFVTGLFDRKNGLCNIVWKVALDGSGTTEFITSLNDPQGLAFDREGILHVAEYGANRVSRFDPAGKPLDSIPVRFPDTIHISHKSGALYVLTLHERTKPIDHGHYYANSHNWKPDRLIKFVDGKSVASIDGLMKGKYGGGAFMALDDSGGRPAVWIGGREYKSGPLYRAEDHGDRFELRAMEQPKDAAPYIGDLALTDDRVLVRLPTFRPTTQPDSLTFSRETGAALPRFAPKTMDGKRENYWQLVYGETISGKDGRIYVHARNTIRRYESDGRPAPFASTGSHVLEGFEIDRHTKVASMFVDVAGTILVGVNRKEAKQLRDDDNLTIMKLSADGEILNESLIEIAGAHVGGIVADSKGFVYLGVQLARPGERVPAWCRDQLPDDSERHHPGSFYAQTGSILKFPPTGGWIKQDPDGPFLAHRQKEGRVKTNGKLIARGGLIPGKYDRSGLGCSCETSRFDIDDNDRIYLPDVHQFCIRIIDTDGNPLGRFGTYGNMDDQGPDITFGWPLSVRVSNGRAFVADLTNRRIVAVKLPSP